MHADTRRDIEALFESYPEKRGALLPALYLVQAERGWIDAEQARELAELFEIAPVEVYEVALPARSFAERAGTFTNHAGLEQAFAAVVEPPFGAWPEGELLREIAHAAGLELDVGGVRPPARRAPQD